jgi:phospholipid/cholesterol/gamma-HCH transport system substrate-binding protein
MEPRVSYALVGLFVLTLGAALILATLWLAGVGLAGDMRPYLVFLEESVAGLTVDSAVKYQGVDVGSVREIALDPSDPSRVRLLIDVRKEIPVNADTVASLSTQGLTGLVYFIELRGGGPQSEPLLRTPGSPYPVIPSEPSLLDRLRQEGFALLESVQAAVAELRETMADARELVGEDNRKAIAAALQDAARFSDRLSHAAGTLDDYLGTLEPVLDDAAHAIKKLRDLADRAKQTLDEAGAAAVKVRRAAERLERLVAESVPGLVELTRDGLPQVAPLLRDLRDLTVRLDRLAADLEKDPGLLLERHARRPGPGER